MKQKSIFISIILAVLIMGFSSCTLFIDDDNLFTNSDKKPLPTYQGKYYDEEVTEKGKYCDVVYQLQDNTLIFNAENELNNYIFRLDTVGYLTNIYFDKSVPNHLLPKLGQPVVSGNTSLFKMGLCDMVYDVGEENGEIVVRLAPTEYTNVFKELKYNFHPDLKEAFRSFSVYDEDGNLLGKNSQNDNIDEANSNKGMKEVLKNMKDDDPYKGYYDIDFEEIYSWGSIGKAFYDIVKSVHDGFQPVNKSGLGKSFNCALKGGIIFPDESMPYNLNPISKDPLYFDVEQLHGGITHIDLDLEMFAGMKDPMWFSIIPDNLQTLIDNFTLGVVSIDLFLECGFKVDGSLNLHPVYTNFWNGRKAHIIGNKTDKIGDDRPSEFDWKDLALKGNIHVPMFRLGIGGGIAKIPIRIYAEIILDPTLSGVIDLKENFADISHSKEGNNSRIDTSGEIQVGLLIRAKGEWISKLLNTIKDKLPSIQRAWEAMGKIEQQYVKTGTLQDWNLYFNELDGHGGWGGGIDPSLAQNMEDYRQKVEKEYFKNNPESNKPGAPTPDFKKIIMEKKNVEFDNVEKEINSKKVKKLKEEKETNKQNPLKPENANNVFEYELGPIPLVQLYKESHYCYPRYIDGSFKIGAKDPFHFTPEFKLDNPGMRSYVLGTSYYVDFAIYNGSEYVNKAELDSPVKKIEMNTPKGTLYKGVMSWFYLDDNVSYTCFPRYKIGNEYVLGRSIPFSAIPPAVAITSRYPEVTDAYYLKDVPEYQCKFTIEVGTDGIQYIKKIGIIDDNDLSNKKYHFDNDAISSLITGDKRAGKGRYKFLFSIKSTSTIAEVSLSPFIIPSDAQLESDRPTEDELNKYATVFSQWKAKIDFLDYINENMSTSLPSSSSNNYSLTLESVEFIPNDDEMTEENEEDS